MPAGLEDDEYADPARNDCETASALACDASPARAGTDCGGGRRVMDATAKLPGDGADCRPGESAGHGRALDARVPRDETRVVRDGTTGATVAAWPLLSSNSCSSGTAFKAERQASALLGAPGRRCSRVVVEGGFDSVTD